MPFCNRGILITFLSLEGPYLSRSRQMTGYFSVRTYMLMSTSDHWHFSVDKAQSGSPENDDESSVKTLTCKAVKSRLFLVCQELTKVRNNAWERTEKYDVTLYFDVVFRLLVCNCRPAVTIRLQHFLRYDTKAIDICVARGHLAVDCNTWLISLCM